MSEAAPSPSVSPAAILALSDAYWKSCALHAAVALDVFTPLHEGPATAAQLAQRLGTDARALAMLLGALRALGLLAREGEGFALVPVSSAYLVRTSPDYKGHIILHHKHLLESFGQLDKAVRTGKRVRADAQFTEAQREAFLLGMFNNAMGIAPRLAAQLDALLRQAGLPGMTGRERLLDLGGGPGTYAIHFCLAQPGLKASVFDLPTTWPFAEATAARFGLAYTTTDKTGGRMSFLSGDYTQDHVPGGFDLAWLSHILHGEGPDMAARIVRKAADGLNPGGLLLVHEFLLDDSLDGPEFPTLFALNMLLGTEGGQAYSDAQVRGMLKAAGLTDIARLDFAGPGSTGIIAGRKA
ncbi:MAG: methyltransferase [Humidesulfovibrio sp.]|nr:methyltransferase [Humidesulfovibrio sp.]